MNKRIVVLGRTGAGKSSLANKIFGHQFKEGHTLVSETIQAEEKILKWPRDPTLKVSWIDTPGFADNRPDTSNRQIFDNILGLLNTLKDGVHLAIYCLPAKSRIGYDELEEIGYIKTLLGDEFLEESRLIIAITRLNTFEENTKREYKENIPNDLQAILAKSNINIQRQNILFSDFDNFDKEFLNPLENFIDRFSGPYLPSYSKKLEEDQRKGLNFLHSEPMQNILAQYNKKWREQEEQLTVDLNNLRKKPSSLFIENQIKKKEAELEKIKAKLEDIKEITGKNPSSSTSRFGFLQKHNLLHLLDKPIKISTIKQNRIEEKDYDSRDPNTRLYPEIPTVYNYGIAGKKYKKFSYCFHQCPSNHNCLILEVVHSNENISDEINEVSLAPNGMVQNFVELKCQLNVAEKSFKVYRGETMLAEKWF